jgi:hypothetical protein
MILILMVSLSSYFVCVLDGYMNLFLAALFLNLLCLCVSPLCFQYDFK